MSDITLINDSEQSSLVTNGLAKNGEMYLKKAGSTDAGSIVVYDSGAWKTFANEYSPGGLVNDYSLSFDGTNDYIQTSYLPSAGSTFSASFWMKTSDTSSSMGWFSMMTGAGTFGVFLLTPSSTKGWYYGWNGVARNATIGGWNATLAVRDGNWHHVAMTVSGTTVKIYTDGTIVGTDTAPSAYSGPTSSSYNYVIGRGYAVGAYQYNGLMDEVALFETELTASQVSDIYNSGVPTDVSASFSPTGYWRMGDNDSGTGTTVTDQGSGGNDGSLINGPSFVSDVPS